MSRGGRPSHPASPPSVRPLTFTPPRLPAAAPEVCGARETGRPRRANAQKPACRPKRRPTPLHRTRTGKEDKASAPTAARCQRAAAALPPTLAGEPAVGGAMTATWRLRTGCTDHRHRLLEPRCGWSRGGCGSARPVGSWRARPRASREWPGPTLARARRERIVSESAPQLCGAISSVQSSGYHFARSRMWLACPHCWAAPAH